MASSIEAPPRNALDVEQRFVIHGVAWKDDVVLREALDIPGLRMTFCRGALELMSPSTEHERIKKSLARLLELYSLEHEVALHGYGSTTFRQEVAEKGVEPDECYTVGEMMSHFPDLAIEVVLTHGGIKKLEAYRGLGVSEVWLWEADLSAAAQRGSPDALDQSGQIMSWPGPYESSGSRGRALVARGNFPSGPNQRR